MLSRVLLRLWRWPRIDAILICRGVLRILRATVRLVDCWRGVFWLRILGTIDNAVSLRASISGHSCFFSSFATCKSILTFLWYLRCWGVWSLLRGWVCLRFRSNFSCCLLWWHQWRRISCLAALGKRWFCNLVGICLGALLRWTTIINVWRGWWSLRLKVLTRSALRSRVARALVCFR